MDKAMTHLIRVALENAVDALSRNSGRQAVVQQVTSAVVQAAQQGFTTFPPAGRPLKGSLSRAVHGPNGALPAPVPAPAPPALPAGGVPGAAANLQSVTNGGGSIQDILMAVFEYEEQEIDAHAQALLAQGIPPAAVARIVAERKAQAAQQNLTTISNISAIEHQTMMSIIGNIR